MRRIARRFSSPIVTAVVVALVVGGATAAAAPTAVTSVVKLAKRATFAKRAGKATRAKYATTAGKAKRATLALSAQVANNSAGLGGHPASDYQRNQHIDFRAQAGTGETTLYSAGTFTLTASCNSSGLLRILASTSVDHSDIESHGDGGDVQIDDFGIADSPHNMGPTQGEYRDIMYTNQAGQVVYIHYLASSENYPPPGSGDPNPDHGSPLGGSVACLVTGFAQVQ
jgi:type II secretory pathway pseudopilin PulG